MKVAICFFGLVGGVVGKDGKGESLDPQIAYDLNYQNLIKNNEADVFIHSWSVEHKDKILKLYKPKDSVIEKQRIFEPSPKLLNEKGLWNNAKTSLKKFLRPVKHKQQLKSRLKEVNRAYSRWYSTKAVLEMKRKFERENDFEYDAVLVNRLDVGFYTPLEFSDFDLEKFYASHWNDYPCRDNNFTLNKENHNTGKGFLDFWFFSNSHNMDSFGSLYDNIDKYSVSPHNSSYEHVNFLKLNYEYVLYRWVDHEMIRRKEFKSIE